MKSDLGMVGYSGEQTDAIKDKLNYQVSNTSGMRRSGEKLRIDETGNSEGDIGKIREATKGTSYDINNNPLIKQYQNLLQKGGKGIPVENN